MLIIVIDIILNTIINKKYTNGKLPWVGKIGRVVVIYTSPSNTPLIR